MSRSRFVFGLPEGTFKNCSLRSVRLMIFGIRTFCSKWLVWTVQCSQFSLIKNDKDCSKKLDICILNFQMYFLENENYLHVFSRCFVNSVESLSTIIQ